MPRWLRTWQLVFAALAILALASILFGVWGFVTVWLTLGFIALVVFLAAGGEPGNAAETYTTEMAMGSVIALVISGPFGFAVIFTTILSPELRRS